MITRLSIFIPCFKLSRRKTVTYKGYCSENRGVTVTINKSAQSIVWNDSFENITVADSIVLTAYAQTPIEYVVSDVELAYITDNNVLYFTRGGNLQVTAHAIEDDSIRGATIRDITQHTMKIVEVAGHLND